MIFLQGSYKPAVATSIKMLPANRQESECPKSAKGTRYKQCSKKIALERHVGEV
jgi:hypothetical protein